MGRVSGLDFLATLLRAHVPFSRRPPCGPGSWSSSGSSWPVVWHPGVGVCPTAWLGTHSSSLGLPGLGVLGERPLGARLGQTAPCQSRPPGGTLVGLALSETLLSGGVGTWGGGSQVLKARPGLRGRSQELTLSSSCGRLHGLLCRVRTKCLERWVHWSGWGPLCQGSWIHKNKGSWSRQSWASSQTPRRAGSNPQGQAWLCSSPAPEPSRGNAACTRVQRREGWMRMLGGVLSGWGHHDRQAGLTGTGVRLMRQARCREDATWGHSRGPGTLCVGCLRGPGPLRLGPGGGAEGTRVTREGSGTPSTSGDLESDLSAPQPLALPFSWQRLHSWLEGAWTREEEGVGASGTVFLGSRPPAGTVAVGHVLGSLGGWISGQWGFG